MEPALKGGLDTQGDTTGESFFLCQQVSSAGSFLVRGKSECPRPPSSTGTAIWLEFVMLPVPVSPHMYQPCCVFVVSAVFPWSSTDVNTVKMADCIL